MKYLIFSDTHLTDQFEERKYHLLASLVEQADRVVINGDLWEGYVIDFDTFVSSKWNGLFPLLKQKKAVYLYGNHDKEEYCDARVSLFSVEQGDSFTFKSGAATFVCEHGHKQYPMIDDYLPVKIPRWWQRFSSFLQATDMKFFGLYHRISKFRSLNEHIKKVSKGRFDDRTFFLTGHTHSAELDHSTRFVNSGIIQFGIAEYVWVEDGKVELVRERY
jgi:predicted phosphodiesterase